MTPAQAFAAAETANRLFERARHHEGCVAVVLWQRLMWETRRRPGLVQITEELAFQYATDERDTRATAYDLLAASC